MLILLILLHFASSLTPPGLEEHTHGSTKSNQSAIEHVTIVKYPSSYRQAIGSSIDLECAATGRPPPLITWLRNGIPLPSKKWTVQVLEDDKYKPYTYYSRSLLRINVTETANYTCYALNQLRNGSQSTDYKSSMVYVASIEDRKDSLNDSVAMGYCAPYSGIICQKYLHGRGLVWFNISKDNAGGWLNEQVTTELWQELITVLKEPCRTAAENLLCKYAFPDCILKDGQAVGLPLCQEDCIALKSHYCFKEWIEIHDSEKRGNFLQTRGHFRLPHCDNLPLKATDLRGKVCSVSTVTSMRWDLTSSTCVHGTGRYYQGKVNQTVEGFDCQDWFSDTPHTQTIKEFIFPEMQLAQNHCRNPGGTERQPWCYTTNPEIRWQYCEIPVCGSILNSTGGGTRSVLEIDFFGYEVILEKFGMTHAIVLTLSCIFVIIVLAITVAIVSRKAPLGYHSEAMQSPVDILEIPANTAYHQINLDVHKNLEAMQYPRNDIIYVQELGQGAFGRVFLGKAPNLTAGEDFTLIAVKMIIEEEGITSYEDLENEAITLASLDHPNIVKLLAVCAIGRPFTMLFEYMPKGDLNTILRNCHAFNHFSPILSCTIDHLKQIEYAKQVCCGMIYLSNLGYVHRDLATRNCLMNNARNIKLADFGLSKKLHKDASWFCTNIEDDKIPIRWMPLESILQQTFSPSSDVWGFGILLWEIFSFAIQPYFGLAHAEVISFLQEGKLLKCPENTPKSIYSLMLSCWCSLPTDRPGFSDIYSSLQSIHNDLCLIKKHQLK